MGAAEIVLMGFTLQSGVGYEHGRMNPVTGKSSFYLPEAPLAWLRWYQESFPGRVKLAKGWSGPIYDAGIFEVIELGRDESAAYPWT